MCPPSDYVPLVNLFGVYFQIRDDFMNLHSTEVRFTSILPSFSSLSFSSVPIHNDAFESSTRITKDLQKTLLRESFLSPLFTVCEQTTRIALY